MHIFTFDTLAATHSLEKTGLPRAQAESIIDTLRQVMVSRAGTVVTKQDLHEAVELLETKIEESEFRLAKKIESVEEKLKGLKP